MCDMFITNLSRSGPGIISDIWVWPKWIGASLVIKIVIISD